MNINLTLTRIPYGDAGAGGRVIIGQLRVWSAGICLIIVVHIIRILQHDPTDCPSVLAVCKTVAQP